MRYDYSVRHLAAFVLSCLLAHRGSAHQVAPARTSEEAPTSTSPVARTSEHSAETVRALVEISQYIIGPADVIRVNVWKNTDLSETVTVGPDGFISLPLLGDVRVSGMTANQLSKALDMRLADFVVKAQVTVSIVEIRSRQVYVMGQVGKPGGYPLITPLTVLQVIAQAGGLTAFAHRKSILILRETNGSTQRLKFDYVAALNGHEKQNIVLQPGDTVVVP